MRARRPYFTDPGFTTRYGPAQRAVFKRSYDREPALGTLAERLDIIIRGFGGTTGPVHATVVERREYDRWLRQNQILNVAA